MDDSFFSAFNEDLRNESAWREFHTSYRKGQGKLRDAASKNPSTLGDPVSLKTESSETESTENGRGARSDVGASRKPGEQAKKTPRPQGEGKLKDAAMKNPSLLGDPVSMQAENKSVGPESNISIPAEASAPTVTSLSSDKAAVKDKASSAPSSRSSLSPPLPSIPNIDGKALFWAIMDRARSPDPYMFPALLRLKSAPATQRPILGALSNTVIFPAGHPYNRLPFVPGSSGSTPSSPLYSPASQSSVSSDDPRTHFDVFIASAEVGMRKPERGIYQLAVESINRLDRENGGRGITAEDIIFLDDIGENLRTAREMGMQTIKVQLNKTFRAVKELEAATGLELMDEKTRRAKL